MWYVLISITNNAVAMRSAVLSSPVMLFIDVPETDHTQMKIEDKLS